MQDILGGKFFLKASMCAPSACVVDQISSLPNFSTAYSTAALQLSSFVRSAEKHSHGRLLQQFQPAFFQLSILPTITTLAPACAEPLHSLSNSASAAGNQCGIR